MVWRNAGGIYERKTPFQMKKEADQTGFKDTRTEPSKHIRALQQEEIKTYIST